MSGRLKIGRVILLVVLLIVAVVVGYLGFIGGRSTVHAGTQSFVCGVRVGVVDASETALISWGDDGRATLAPGERTRIAPWCVVEVDSIEGSSDEEADGGGPTVNLRWRLW